MKRKKHNKVLLEISAFIIGVAFLLFNDDITAFINNNEINDNNENYSTAVDGDLNIYYLDVGQADSILIRLNNENMLIDAGNNDDGNKLVKYFKDLGVEEFKYVVGTHAHEDHIGGMDDIIKNFKIDTFYMPDVITTTKTFEDVLDALDEKNVSFDTPAIGDTFKLNNAVFKVLYVGTDKTNLNDTSIVLSMVYGDKKYLFTGDATENVENKILNEDIKADVLKVGHHGSGYSTTDDFLDKVNPSYAIISVGLNNTYDHPKKSTIDKLNNKKIKIYRTDEDGTILLISDGSNIKFKTIKTDTNG